VLQTYSKLKFDITLFLGVYTPMQSLIQQNNLQNCACFNIRKSARVLTQQYDEALQFVGLRSTQFSILAMISRVEAITITELADSLLMDRTTLTRNLRPLEKQNLVKTVPGEDRRTRIISISKIGLSKLKEAIPLWKQVQQTFIDYMGASRFKHLLGELSYVEKMTTIGN